MVTYYTISPPAHLAMYVRFFWVFEMKPDVVPYVYRSMADGCTEMIFHYKGVFKELDVAGNGAQAYSMLHGQSQQYRRFITDGDFGIFGVYLYPFAVPELFRISAHILSNEMPDLQTLLGADGVALEEKMMLAANNQQRCALLTAFIESRLVRNNATYTSMHTSVRHVIDKKGMVNVQQLANQYCLSERQFHRRFKELSGFTPKLYSRIARFQHVMSSYGKQQISMANLAYNCGYYDQSHFIHDFRQFSGYTPTQYFNGQPEGAEYRDV